MMEFMHSIKSANGALAAVMAGMMLTACVQEVNPAVVQQLHSVVLGVGINDVISGKKQNLLLDDRFDDTPVNWNSTDYIQARLKSELEADGKQVQVISLTSDFGRLTPNQVPSYVQQTLSKQYPADSYLLMFTRNAFSSGDLLHAGSNGYILDSHTFGISRCYQNFDIMLVDAQGKLVSRSGETLFMADSTRLPEFVWADSYSGLTASQKEIVRTSCMKGLADSAAEMLEHMGIKQRTH